MRRLLKEEASYRKEQIGQEMRLAELQKIPPGSDENWEFRVRQEVCVDFLVTLPPFMCFIFEKMVYEEASCQVSMVQVWCQSMRVAII